MMARPGGGPNPFTPEMFTRMYVITYSIMTVGTIILGSIYPAVLIWLLSKRSVKAACGEGVAAPVQQGDELA